MGTADHLEASVRLILKISILLFRYMKIEELFPEAIEEIYILVRSKSMEVLEESQWISGRFDRNM